MSRGRNRNQKEAVVRENVVLEGDTILDQFRHYLFKHRKVSDIIGFLSIQNARLIGILANMEPWDLPENIKEEIMDFAEYFFDDFDDVTRLARMENWGEDDALILRVANILFEEEEEKAFDEDYGKLTDSSKKEIETLRDTIFAVRENRIVTAFMDGEIYQLKIPKRIYREQIDYIKREIQKLVYEAFVFDGTLVVRELKNGTIEVYGYKFLNGYHVWTPITEEELKETALVTPSGFELEQEEGVKYVCRPREKF